MDSAPSYDYKSQPLSPPYPTDPNAGAYPQPPAQPYAYPPQNPPYPGPQAPGATYYPAAQPVMQQQQSGVVIVNAASQAPVFVQSPPVENYSGYIAFACIVFWCCNALFGLIAFILAIVADNTKHQDQNGARRLGKASLWLSISGIIVTCIIIAIAVGVSVGTAANCKYYYINGRCYTFRSFCPYYSYSAYSCSCTSSYQYYYNDYCYSN